MTNHNIFNLFPTPIYIGEFRKFTKKEIDLFKKQEIRSNSGNRTSVDAYILNQKEMAKLNKDICQHINEYVKQIISPRQKVDFFITQSWLNYTSTNEYHHKHTHPNSIISGVLYIDVDDEDRIYFHNNKPNQIKFDTSEYNMYNSETWWLPAEKNKLLLFPSWQEHSVDAKQTDKERISLAFNVFAKGIFGNYLGLTELIV